MNRALRFTLLGLAVAVVVTGCGSSTRHAAQLQPAWRDNAVRAIFRDRAAEADLAAMFDCFEQNRWRMEIRSGSRPPYRPWLRPMRVLAAMWRVEHSVHLRSTQDLEASQNLPNAYVYRSASEAHAHLRDFLGNPDLRAGTKPELVGRTIFFWVTTQHPWPNIVKTMRKCSAES